MVRLFIAFVACLLSACASLRGPELEVLGVSAQAPSQVALYLRATDDGAAFTDLEAEDFKVYEDDQALLASQTRQVLLNRELAAAHHALLLVDNSLATDAGVRQELATAIGIFVERVRGDQPVTVYAFDGGADIHLIAEFPREKNAGAPDVRRLAQLEPADTSRNLVGAVEKGAIRLAERLRRRPQALKVGTLVVFSGGPDLAGRGDESAMVKAIEEHELWVLSIGIGDDVSELQAIGEAGFVDAHSADTLSLAFEEAAHRVQDAYARHYLFAYCSPARAGVRRVRLELERASKDGSARRGEAQAEFDAKGFRAGCDPRATPRFRP